MPAFNMLAVALQDMRQFIFWAFVACLVVFVVFSVSIIRPLERALEPFLLRAKHWAPDVARVTLGLAFLAGAYYQASYGPELPLASTFGVFSPLATIALIGIALAMLCNVQVRAAALVALCVYLYNVSAHGIYMLTYANYLGEIIVLLIGAHEGARALRGPTSRVVRALAPYRFAILRICFGTSLLYASLYAKILHNNLALMVADLPLAGHPYGIAHYLGFEPHFLVVGAAIVELLIGSFFLLGVEIRFTALFIEFWLTLSLIYFGEVVWPHLILIGIPIAFLLHGYDRYSLEGLYLARGRREPVL